MSSTRRKAVTMGHLTTAAERIEQWAIDIRTLIPEHRAADRLEGIERWAREVSAMLGGDDPDQVVTVVELRGEGGGGGGPAEANGECPPPRRVRG